MSAKSRREPVSLPLFVDHVSKKPEAPKRLSIADNPWIIKEILEEIQVLYASDDMPWIVGYSGGKDSSATLQLVWMAIQSMPHDRRTKPIHVISTDTLVENPVVARWAEKSLERMREQADAQGLPIQPHRLTPDPTNTFWVNLIGRGYAAPRQKFRWCTERLKIDPSNKFITETTDTSGGSILVLGTRKAESVVRRKRMEKLEAERVRERLSPNAALGGNALVYSPIEDWTSDDVWLFLSQVKNPWGWDNHMLRAMYRAASDDNECPLVVDTSTPSCGNSRFGCWVCTLVEEDKSMTAMIQNEDEHEWMAPLLDLRNRLDFRKNENGDRHLRDFRRMQGHVTLMANGTKVVPGPYLQHARAEWLRLLLRAQTEIRKDGPDHVRDIELITQQELETIRRIWMVDKREVEDLLPKIYEEETGQKFVDPTEDAYYRLQLWNDLDELKNACEGDDHRYQLARGLGGVCLSRKAYTLIFKNIHPGRGRAFTYQRAGVEIAVKSHRRGHRRGRAGEAQLARGWAHE